MLREMTEEIKNLKAMLEGKMPVSFQPSGNQTVERIVYRNADGSENKENNEALEQELRNKDELLRI